MCQDSQALRKWFIALVFSHFPAAGRMISLQTGPQYQASHNPDSLGNGLLKKRKQGGWRLEWSDALFLFFKNRSCLLHLSQTDCRLWAPRTMLGFMTRLKD